MSELVLEALACHERGQHDDALRMLLQRWGETRHPELAAVIETLSTRLDPGPLTGKTRAQRRQRWLDVAEDKADRDVPRLLAAITTFNCGDATELLADAVDWAPDPRVSAYLVSLLVKPPDNYQGYRQAKFWRTLVAAMTTSADPRALSEVTRLAALHARPQGPTGLETLIAPKLAALATHLGTLKANASDEELEAIGRFAARLRPGKHERRDSDRAASLLQAVYDDPADDELRLVLADALTEVGDPRGEFILVQTNLDRGGRRRKDMRRRNRELLEAYERTWLGGIEGAMQKSGLEYRRGFVAAGRAMTYKVDDPARVMACREWATFEELDVSRVDRFACEQLFDACAFKVLRALVGLRAPRLFTSDRRYAIETLGVLALPADIEEFAGCSNLPRLRHLDLRAAALDDGQPLCHVPANLRWLFADGALGHQLTSLTVAGLAAWLREAHTDPPPVAELVMQPLGHYGWGGTLIRDSSGVFSELRLRGDAGVSLTGSLRAALAGSLPTSIRRVRLQLHPSDRPTADRLSQWRTLLERGGAVQVLAFPSAKRG